MSRAFLLHQLLDRAAERHPERVVLVTEKGKTTYRELAEGSGRVAATLERAGVGPGDPVALCLEKSPDAIAALFGVLRRGACYVPLDPFAPKARIATVLERAEIRVLVSSADKAPALAEGLRALESPPACLETVVTRDALGPGRSLGALRHVAWAGEQPAAGVGPAVTESHLACILHTSGSTGVPKGVAITHRAALSFIEMAAAFFDASADDVFAGHAPLTFDLSVFDLFVAIHAGASVVLLPDFYAAFPKKIAHAIQNDKITVWSSVVSALSLLVGRVSLSDYDLSSIRLCIFSGEVMPIPVLRKVREAFSGAELFNVYGQTEANSSLYYRVDAIPEDDAAGLPIGRPFPNFDAFVVTESGELATPGGGAGELYVRAPTVAAGYYRDPDRTKEKFVEDPLLPGLAARVYRTGDRARIDEAGLFWFCGRADDLVKVRGYRVELSEVELALASAPGVAEAAVLAVPDESVGHRLVGFVRGEPGASCEPAALTTFLSARLPKYMIPDPITVSTELARTSTGKIDKRALRAEIDAAASAQVESGSPS